MAMLFTRLYRNINNKWARPGQPDVDPTGAPTISDISPRSGAIGATLTVSGFNLGTTVAVRFIGSGGTGSAGVDATFTVVSASSLLVTIPAGAPDGPITVTNTVGTTTSVMAVDVISPPTISSFSPSSGAVASSITITGTNLTGATTVRFGATDATTYSVVSSTQITATVPAGASSGTITVITPGGTATSTGSFTVSAGTGTGGFTLTMDEQFADLTTNQWFVDNNDGSNGTGAPTLRQQTYMAYNVQLRTGVTDATNGTALEEVVQRENVLGQPFTSGFISSKPARFYPLWGRFEARQRIPHGQGLWPAFWLTARLGGADMCEVDIMESFHAQVAGYLTMTLHRTNSAGTIQYNVAKKQCFFEAPTYTPQFTTTTMDILPWTATTVAGGTVGDFNTQTASNVLFRGRVNGTIVWEYVDTSASFWTTNGGSLTSFWNIYINQQVAGQWVGHPDDPLGYSRVTGNCISSGGTAPNACSLTGFNLGNGAYPIQRAGSGGNTRTGTADLATTTRRGTSYTIDYVRVYKYTG